MTYLTSDIKWKKHEAKKFLWNELRENFIKEFSFILEDTKLVEATKQIKIFIQLNTHESTKNRSRPNAACYNIRSNKIP